MPHIQLIVNGNGQIQCYPNQDVPSGTVVTIRSFPFTGEVLDTIVFYEYYGEDWHEVGVTQTDWRTWKFRIENNDMRVDALFTSRHPAPPDPPPIPPDPPTPSFSNWLFPTLRKAKLNQRRFMGK